MSTSSAAGAERRLPFRYRRPGVDTDSFYRLSYELTPLLRPLVVQWAEETLRRAANGRQIRVLQLALEINNADRAQVIPLRKSTVSSDIVLEIERIDWDGVDAILGGIGDFYLDPESLEEILEAGGCAYKVSETVTGHFGLVERVPGEIADRAEALVAEDANSSRYLAEAWALLYDRARRNDAGAIFAAGKAVESAAQPVISPKDASATLTKMAGVIRDGAGKNKWTLHHSTFDVLQQRMKSIFEAQERHGAPDGQEPEQPPTREQAEAVVHDAFTLVHWFRSGVIVPNS